MVRIALALALAAPGHLSAAPNALAQQAAAPISDPKLLSVKPRFASQPDFSKEPAIADRAPERGGTVRVRLTISPKGALIASAIDQGSGDPAIDPAILRAVGKAKLRGGSGLDGKPVATTIVVSFALSNSLKRLTGTEPAYPEAARMAGHNGEVIATGTIGTDGTLGELRIDTSSRSPLLDQAVLDALVEWTFTPPKDLSGAPRTLDVKYSFNFSAAKGDSGGYVGGLKLHSCADFCEGSRLVDRRA